MAGFLYYLPGAELSDLVARDQYIPEVMEKWGLSTSLSDCSIYPDHIMARRVKGPDGGMGMLLSPRSIDGGEIGSKTYSEETQEWRLAEDCSGKWIGWLKDDPPGPHNLVKRDAIGCKYIFRDARDNEWAIVTARSKDSGAVSLPSSYTFKDGKLTTRVKPKYMPLYELSGMVFDHMSVLFVAAEDCAEFVKDEEFLVHAAVKVISVNYRIDIAEIAALDEMDYQLLVTENVTGILLSFVDQPILEEFQSWVEALRLKKSSESAQTSESCSSGQEDSTPTIDLADVEPLSLK